MSWVKGKKRSLGDGEKCNLGVRGNRNPSVTRDGDVPVRRSGRTSHKKRSIPRGVPVRDRTPIGILDEGRGSQYLGGFPQVSRECRYEVNVRTRGVSRSF